MYMSINEFIVNLIGHTHMALPAMIAAENLIPFTGFLAHNQLMAIYLMAVFLKTAQTEVLPLVLSLTNI